MGKNFINVNKDKKMEEGTKLEEFEEAEGKFSSSKRSPVTDEEYEIAINFIEKYADEIKKGEPVLVEIRDNARYKVKRVRALISKDEEAIPDGNILWIRNINELIESEPVRIKILEEIDPDSIKITAVKPGRNEWP